METLFVGLGYILLGVLIKLFPGLIAGYSTLSQKERESVNENRFPTIMMIGFCIMGILVIAGHFIAQWLGSPTLSMNINMILIILAIVVFIILGQRYRN